MVSTIAEPIGTNKQPNLQNPIWNFLLFRATGLSANWSTKVSRMNKLFMVSRKTDIK